MNTNYDNLIGMQKAREPVVQHIPFVAGKSLNKSHNIGINIQQTKSLMTQTNKKVKLKKPPLSPSHEDIHHTGHSIASTLDRRNSDTCPVLKYLTKNSDTCPVLKYQSYLKPRLILDDIDDVCNEVPKEKLSIEEIWANYMYEVESKHIMPVKCTCFPLKTKKIAPKQNKDAAAELAKKFNRQKKDDASIYSEARKVMNDCRVVLSSSEEQLGRDDICFVEDFDKMPTRSTKMARYMQQIKQLQHRLSK